MEDIQGADMLYEVEREKFGLIQYKKSSSTSVKNDEEQLQALISNCPDVCTHKKKRPIPVDWVPLKLNSYCGCWYSVIDEEGQKRYMHACEAEAIFRGRKSGQVKNFDIGLTRETFLELFSSCRIGAFLRAVPREGDHRPSDYIDHLVEEQHVILEVRQQNRR